MPTVNRERELIDEPLTPAPDGVRTDFFTSRPYRVQTVSVWLNGLRKIRSFDDGWEEPGGTTVRMKEPPPTGSTLEARYDPD